MRTIQNLAIFLAILCVIVYFCNYKNNNKIINNNIEPLEKFNQLENKKNKIEDKKIPSGYPTIVFDYETVPENTKKFDLDESFHTQLEKGAFYQPHYPTDNDKLVDQRVVYDNKLYEKPIHRYRTLEIPDNEPKKISDIFDESIIDFKKLVPLKNGIFEDKKVDGNFEQSSYGPDFISYKDEKPENGGFYDSLNLFGFDPLINNNTAVF